MKLRLPKATPLVVLMSFIVGCASTNPYVNQDDTYLIRSVSKSRSGISVSASVLDKVEIETVFGVRLDSVGIQPVWLKIQNLSAYAYVLFLKNIDPDYFSPYEVANRASALSSKSKEDLYIFMRDMEIQRVIAPGAEVEGYVYTHLDEGIKSINVSLFGNKKMESFQITVEVPGLITDFDDFDPSIIYEESTPSLSEQDLRSWLESLPCCTSSKGGAPGDPINLIFVGTIENIKAALVSQHWDVTADTTGSSIGLIVRAFIFGSRYRYAPVSDLFLFGRQQDISFQKSRAAIDERNHVRLWLAPVTHDGTPVWVGHISRDAGIKFSGRFWPPTTHVIDPAVDEARYYIEQDLLYSQRVKKIGLVSGAIGTSVVAPRHNAEGDPYFTDGLRAVFIIDDRITPINNIEVLDWVLPCEMEPFRNSFYDCVISVE
jgi:hypothetical protein